MNKKTLISYVLAAILVIVIIHYYRAHHAAPTTPKAALPAIKTKPEEAKVAPAAVPNKDRELLATYTAQINAGKDDEGNVYMQRGLLYVKMQQYRDAIADFSSALKIVPDSPSALFNRALAYEAENMLDKALLDLTQAIKIKPNFADAYNARGLIYVEQNDFPNAITDYNNAVALDPKFDEAYFNLGILYTKQKQFKDAKDAFDKAISNNVPAKDATPEDLAISKKRLMQSYLNRANVNLISGDFKAALADATYVVTNDPTSVDALRLRSVIYDKLGDSAAATNDTAAADNLSMQNLLNTKQ